MFSSKVCRIATALTSVAIVGVLLMATTESGIPGGDPEQFVNTAQDATLFPQPRASVEEGEGYKSYTVSVEDWELVATTYSTMALVDARDESGDRLPIFASLRAGDMLVEEYFMREPDLYVRRTKMEDDPDILWISRRSDQMPVWFLAYDPEECSVTLPTDEQLERLRSEWSEARGLDDG